MKNISSKFFCFFIVLFFYSSIFVSFSKATPPDKQKLSANEKVNSKKTATKSKITPENIEQKIKEIERSPKLDENLRKEIIKKYNQVLVYLKQALEFKASEENYQQALNNAPVMIDELRRELSMNLQNEKNEIEIDIPINAKAIDLEIQLAKEQAELLNIKNSFDKKENEIKLVQNREKLANQEIQKSKQRFTDINKELKLEPDIKNNLLLNEVERALLESEKIARIREIAMLDREISSETVRLSLLDAQHDLLKQKLSQHEKRLKRLGEELQKSRSSEAEDAKKEAQNIENQAVHKHELLKKFAEGNTKLGEELTIVVKETSSSAIDKQLKEAQKIQMDEVYDRTRSLLEQTGLSHISGKAMREQRRRLPELVRDNKTVSIKWRGKVSEAESRRFQIIMDQRDLSNEDQYISQTMETEVEKTITENQRKMIITEFRILIKNRMEMLRKLNDSYSSYLKVLRDLEFILSQLDSTTKDFSILLDKWLLWIPSSSPIDIKTISYLGTAIISILAPKNLLEVYRALLNDFKENTFIIVLAIFIFLGFFKHQKQIYSYINILADRVNQIYTDQLSHSIMAIFMTALFVLPVPLLLSFIGWRLMSGSNNLLFGFGKGLFAVSQLFFALYFLISMCDTNGLARVHFNWPDDVSALLRKSLKWLLSILIVVSFIVVLTENFSQEEIRNSLGRIVFIFGMIAQGIFMQTIVKPSGIITRPILIKYPGGWLSRLRYLWYSVAVGISFILAFIAGIGYYFTALEFEIRVIYSAWLLVGIIIIYNFVLRWLVLRQSKMDIQKIDAQTRKLLKTIIGTAIVVGLWLIWKNVLPALAILGDIKLWSTKVINGNGNEIIQWITMEHMALAVITLVLTIAAAKNLPGVIEFVILKNLPFEAGFRYAITTISRYIFSIIGALIIFKIIGLSWSNIQWLVAALSVGIGFGLQEIISNFICGLILLFERPIRIGDIVKVGDVFGEVLRIRIRATTIVDWDRIEYIVPNKELITSKLLNWTLSDTINRIKINIGIAYGSDTEKARNILLKVAKENPFVIKEPVPTAIFESFGDNSLNFTLRCYLSGFENRLEIIHELHTSINKAFNEAGIDIAFPQLDIHVKEKSN